MTEFVGCVWGEDKDSLVFEVRRTWWGRLRGLLGTRHDTTPIVLIKCSSIHTFGMRYAIDVALVDKEGLVLASRKDLAPGQLLSARRGTVALERPHSDGAWPREGDVVQLETMQAGGATLLIG